MKNIGCNTIQSIKNVVGYQVVFATLMILFMFNGLMSAQSDRTEFVSFQNFMTRTASAEAGQFINKPGNRVHNIAAFEEMREHILGMYQGVEVSHSFVVGSEYYDCVPIEQQPAVRKFGLKQIATPPPASLLDESSNSSNSNIKTAFLLDPEKDFDAFGNSVHCENQTVPMQRVTLETTSRFETLQQFFQKSPNEAGPGQDEKLDPKTPGGDAHKYSYTYQNVNNFGGNSNLNVWAPYVNTAEGEVFSLSQEWYVGGSGAGLQTEEVGWVVYPGMFGDENPHFFIFSTPDNYKSGCWNNSCGDFVQVADSGLLGATLSPVSTTAGPQYEISARYYLFQHNWWLQEQGTWIGYYPGSMYGSGQNSKHAQAIEFGTEGVGSNIWPPEGSGAWPSKGFGYAAYQRNLYYTNTSNDGIWDSLIPVIPSPKCYSIAGPYSGSGAWTVYFYEGGPGGKGC